MSTKQTTFGSKLITYAQNSEDMKLFGYFRTMDKPGFYVDVGANHPVHDSVTQFFYARGWTGINIEPQAHLTEQLKISRPRDKNLCVGIASKPGSGTFRQYAGDGLSTFSRQLHKSYETAHTPAATNYRQKELPLKTLESILHTYARNKTIHFMKIDVEGYEYEVIKSNNWKQYRPWVLCIEATGSDRRWQEILGIAKYVRHMYDGLNEYYVAAEHTHLMDNYQTIVASETIRYDIANRPAMRIGVNIRRVLKKLK